MNLNIALNTIIYIMVFLFPGVIFRRFYFLDSNKSQFSHGHLLERFLMIILSSIFCLIITFVLGFVLGEYFGLRFINNISYEDFKELFKSLAKNELPVFFDQKENFRDFSILFISTYIFSGLIGWVFYVIVKAFRVDDVFLVLRFNNEWDYLFKVPKKNLVKRKPFQKLNVSLDILTKGQNQEVLYQGFLYKLLYNKDNELDSIAISNVSRFIEIDRIPENENKITDIQDSIAKKEYKFSLYKKFQNKIIFKKHIESDIFVIDKKDIINYNLIFVKDLNFAFFQKKWLILIIRTFIILSLLIVPTLIIFIFVESSSEYFESIWKRIVFALLSITQLIATIGVVSSLVKKEDGVLILKSVCLFLFFGVFYLSFFSIVPWYVVIGLSISILIVIGILERKGKEIERLAKEKLAKEKSAKENEEN
ncbi:hypothetical protein [Flavobacterium sp. NKUCC04_CG]|uniref:hypothetical protein n=1 Tax=Flavobacterium sp. NKUCC04_CG TaxID=2842121 RepID=UPI001C5B185D|nr:hypothetical protein [Flavobacterium sp. NKUCC04_CG]MBW3519493.1 hypothetical protein [Flavobacterium sp. NKUCC04_CG]